MIKIGVRADFDAGGNITPTAFTIFGREHPVESVGRRWQDDEGLHILVMTFDQKVHHLLFSPPDSDWYYIPRAGQLPADMV